VIWCPSLQRDVLKEHWMLHQQDIDGLHRAGYLQLSNLIICPIALAYSMGQILKSVCVCLRVCVCVCVCVSLRALSRSHFLIDFHQNWHRRKKPQKEERVR